MMKKNILFMLFGLFVLVSCEKDIFNDSDKLMTIEQFSPVLENGAMKLSGRVNLPAELNRETVKVGFYVTEYNKEMFDYEGGVLHEDRVYWAYHYLMGGSSEDGFVSSNGAYYEDNNEFYWVDEIASDGTFEVSFMSQMKQYICIAFAVNALDYNPHAWCYHLQLLQSKPYFFTGEETAKLELINPMFNEFRLSFSQPEDQYNEHNAGLCWSATDKEPDLEDNRFENYANYNDSNFVDFDWIDFGDHDVVYVRGYVKNYFQDDYQNEVESYKVIYSNVIEIRPKELKYVINSKEEFQEFINSLYVFWDPVNNYYNYRGDEWWRSFRGRIQFNYAVEKTDWLDRPYLESYWGGDSTYLRIPELNGTIEGKGVIPEIYKVNEQGVVKGMTVLRCDENYGKLENLQGLTLSSNYGEVKGGKLTEISTNRGQIIGVDHVRVETNYGSLTASEKVYVNYNHGLVQDCTDVVGKVVSEGGWEHDYNTMVVYNQKLGKMIDCSIATQNADSTYVVCYYNYGYMENCLPESSSCVNNYGIIKKSK